MHKYVRALTISAIVLSAAPLSVVAADDVQPSIRPVLTIHLSPTTAEIDSASEWSGRVVGVPGSPAREEEKESKAAPALPTFRSTIVAGGKRYPFTMVGSNPLARGARNVTVPVQIFPVRFEFADGTVLDPAQPNPCTGGAAPLDLVLQSPLFQNVNYGEGPKQFEEEMRRLEFWTFTGGPQALNPRYSVRVVPSVPATIRVTLPASYKTGAAPCGRAAVIGVDVWQQIFAQISPQFRRLGVGPQTFPLFLSVSVASKIPNENGLAFGFHTANGAQTWGVALWDATNSSQGSADISILSHELAEWYDDPFVNNPTPPWGHVGQVSGCQANLEVGDPLTGTLFGEIEMTNGFTYHPQELAFFSWFFGQVPSWGIGGWYSSADTFKAPAAHCR